MQMTTYLSFRGQCEEALKYYETTLGARVGALFRYEGTPLADSGPGRLAGQGHARHVTVGDQVLMAGDIAPERYEAPKGFSLSLQIHEPGRRRAHLSRVGDGRRGRDAAREDVLGRTLRHGGGSVRDPMDDQLRRIRCDLGAIGGYRTTVDPTSSRSRAPRTDRRRSRCPDRSPTPCSSRGPLHSGAAP